MSSGPTGLYADSSLDQESQLGRQNYLAHICMSTPRLYHAVLHIVQSQPFGCPSL